MSNASDFVIENGVLTKYVGPGGDVIIPEGVTEIGRRAFYGNIMLTRIILPEGVTSIGSMAFEECKGLLSVSFPNSLTTIGAAAFRGCRSLTSIIIPEGCCTIGDNAFAFCEAMREIKLPGGLKKISKGLLSGCKSLKTVTLPEKIKTISDWSLWPCAFELLTILGTPKISLMAFGRTQKDSGEKTPALWCPDMQLSDIPKPYVNAAVRGFVMAYFANDPKIADRKAEYNKWLKSQRGKLMSQLVRDEMWLTLFLTEQILSQKEAGDLLENYKDKLSVSSTAKLMEYMQGDQESLSLELPTKEKPVSLTALKKIWTWKETKDGTISISSYKGNLDDIIVPNTIGEKRVSEIGEYAFSIDAPRVPNSTARRNIKRIVLPDSVKIIGDCAFEGCMCLKQIVLSKDLTVIRSGSFAVCESLVSIAIPESVTSIGKGAFQRCTSLHKAIIPDGVQKIENRCFEDCPNLTIHAPAGSYAEQYAKEHNIPFVAE